MVSASMAIQHAKWLEAAERARRGDAPVASLNVLLTSTCWRNDHNGFSHQGPGLIDTMISLRGERRPRLPAARRQLPARGRRALPAQPRLRQPDRRRQAAAAAVPRPRGGPARTPRAGASRLGVGEHRRRRATPTSSSPAIGDVPTLEIARRRGAAARARPRAAGPRRQRRRPDARSRRATCIRTGSPEDRFDELFGDDDEVVFAFHGYARRCTSCCTAAPIRAASTSAASASRARRPRPFDMVVLNGMSRYHLALRGAASAAGAAVPRRRRASGALRGDARPPPRLRPRALRGPARGPRLDLAGLSVASASSDPRRQRRLLIAEAAGARRRTIAARRAADRRRRADERRAATLAAILPSAPDCRRGRPSRRPRRAPSSRADPAVDADRRAASSERLVGPRARSTTRRPSRRSERATAAAGPDSSNVACFDTAFHATLPAAAFDLRPACGLDRALAAAPLRLPRPLPRLRRRRRAAALLERPLPTLRLVTRAPRRGRLAGGGRGRPLDRHDDGLHPARRTGDGDPLGLRRPGAAALGAAPRRDLGRRGRGEPWSVEAGACGVDARPRRTRTSARLASTSIHRLAADRVRWRQRSAVGCRADARLVHPVRWDLNPRPPGYEPGELPDCSTPRRGRNSSAGRAIRALSGASAVPFWRSPIATASIATSSGISSVR